MRSTTALLILVIITLTLSGVNATVETICKAASDKDAQVNYTFCVSELKDNPWYPNGDEWGLAKAAAEVGVVNAYRARNVIDALLLKPGIYAKEKAPLKLCDVIYLSMSIAFARANHMINEHNYTAGKEAATNAISLAYECDDVFAKAKVPSPVVDHSLISVQIAIVCGVITNLIKG